MPKTLEVKKMRQLHSIFKGECGKGEEKSEVEGERGDGV
jgi:hypothetical protein